MIIIKSSTAANYQFALCWRDDETSAVIKFDETSSSVHDPNIHVIYYINETVAATASQSAADDKAENKKMEQDYIEKKWKIW